MSKKQAIFILVGVGIVFRLCCWYGYDWSVSSFNDTETYTVLAERISALNLAGYNGERTPMYPLLLLLGGLNLHLVVVLQLVLGILCSFLIP